MTPTEPVPQTQPIQPQPIPQPQQVVSPPQPQTPQTLPPLPSSNTPVAAVAEVNSPPLNPNVQKNGRKKSLAFGILVVTFFVTYALVWSKVFGLF